MDRKSSELVVLWLIPDCITSSEYMYSMTYYALSSLFEKLCTYYIDENECILMHYDTHITRCFRLHVNKVIKLNCKMFISSTLTVRKMHISKQNTLSQLLLKSTWVYFTQIFMPISVLCFTHYSDRFIVDITYVFKNWFNYPIFEPASWNDIFDSFI